MDQAVHQAQSPAPALPNSGFTTPPGMSREQFRAMGTTISLLLPTQQKEKGTDIVRKLFHEWEQVLSRFLPESELAWLNKHSGEVVVVSDLFYHILTTALDAAKATDGVYDPTLLQQLVLLGYDRTFEEVATRFSLPRTLTVGKPGGAWRQIRLHEERHSVLLPVGVGLDFGGIAKGMAVDAALQSLLQAGIEVALVNAGGDLAVLGAPPHSDGWSLTVPGVPPHSDGWSLTVPGKDKTWITALHRGAMATSSIAHRHWRQGEYEHHHLLDPRTGMPSQSELWSVTVVADRCEQAEVAAKVAFILGQEQGINFLREHHLVGLLVAKDGCWQTTGAWPLRQQEDL